MIGWKNTASLEAARSFREIVVPDTVATKPLPDHAKRGPPALLSSTRPIQRMPGVPVVSASEGRPSLPSPPSLPSMVPPAPLGPASVVGGELLFEEQPALATAR
jgi:hypothetical protein